jgi:hypothetical protein
MVLEEAVVIVTGWDGLVSLGVKTTLLYVCYREGGSSIERWMDHVFGRLCGTHVSKLKVVFIFWSTN